MMGLLQRISYWLCAPALVIMSMAGSAPAQVQTDGSMGPAVSLSGNMVIANSLGTQAGANLFHSFSVFNIQTGESALFTSTFSGLTQNVIARVTGSNSSWIDGTLASDISGADLWLINPNGLAFGQNAFLDVQGSFHASTADYLGFEDGKRFEAKVPVGPEVLSVANPSAFGFLNANPAPITVNGSFIQVPDGKSLSLVGGDMDISGDSIGTLLAPGGRIDLVSVSGTGEARLNGSAAIEVGSFAGLGNISLRDGGILNVGDSTSAGGAVHVRGGRFVMTNNAGISNYTGANDSGPIDISVTGDISIMETSKIDSFTYDDGRAADIYLSAGGDFTIAGQSSINSITTSGSAFGDSGSISVSAGNVNISDGSKISTNNWFTSSNAGAIDVTASNTILISGPSDFTTGIESSSLVSSGDSGKISLESRNLTMNGGIIDTHNLASMGAAGDISVKVDTMALSDEALISSSSRGDGPGGTMAIRASEKASLTENSQLESGAISAGAGGAIQITTPELTLDQSTITTMAGGDGKAGDIVITGNILKLISSIISSGSMFAGSAGNISITADSSIELKNAGTSGLERSGIVTATNGSGDAGSIAIWSSQVSLDDGYVDSSAGLLSTGDAGTISMDVNDLSLSHGGLVQTESAWGGGEGGTIDINATGTISISGFSPTTPEVSSIISSDTYSIGNAGQVSITAKNISLSLDGSIAVASFAEGSAGTLQINADTVTIDGSGSLYPPGFFSGAYGSGPGGNILLTVGQMTLVNGVISARSRDTGTAGSLVINVAGTLNLTDSTIWTSSDLTAGGNIGITVGDQLRLQNSMISASANGVTPTDNGGNLTMGTPQFMIFNNSSILARANAGNGGNITLSADYFLQSADSTISATSTQGIDGEIIIDSPNQVRGTMALLELPSIDIAALLRERCAAAALREQSSFTIEGLSGIPQRPGDFLVSPRICFNPENKKLSDSSNPGNSGTSNAGTPYSRKATNGGTSK
jgi:filamentous hemagglutinin family protein